jgi:hypothetical protein
MGREKAARWRRAWGGAEPNGENEEHLTDGWFRTANGELYRDPRCS